MRIDSIEDAKSPTNIVCSYVNTVILARRRCLILYLKPMFSATLSSLAMNIFAYTTGQLHQKWLSRCSKILCKTSVFIFVKI